jgi:predicted Zn-dependent protease
MSTFRSTEALRQTIVRRGYLALLLCLTGLVACGVNLFSINDDASFGKQMDQEIRSNPSQYPILQNEAVRSYVQGVVNKIIQSPQIKYRGTFPYTVTIINDDKTINAFATPGGYIYVYTGLLKFIEDEATLAGVVGHEIAHSEERHGTQHMTEAMGADVALQVALGNNPSRLAQIAGNAAVLLATLRNSRSDETDADTKSFAYLKSTPYYPGAIIYFFEKMLRQSGGSGQSQLDEWLSDHPTDQSRIDNVNKLIRDSQIPPPTPNSLMRTSYQAMLRQLR